MPRIPPEGWSIELTHPTSGRVVTPTILDDPEFTPTPNGLPELRAPVERREIFAREEWEGAAMTAYADGQRAPIDELDRVEVEAGNAVLVGVGGTELRNRVQVGVDVQRTHLLAEDLIETHTNYIADVDEPQSPQRNDVLVQSPDSEVEFSEVITPDDTDPFGDRGSGTFGIFQTAWTSADAAAKWTLGGDGFLIAPDDTTEDVSGGFAWQLNDTGAYAELDFTPEYTIPGRPDIITDEFIPWVRNVAVGAGTTRPTLEASIDGDVIAQIESNGSIDWSAFTTGSEVGSIEGGVEHTFRVERQTPASETNQDVLIDAIAPLDARYSYTFDNATDSSGDLSGPEHYPDEVRIDFDDYIDPFFIIGGSATVTMGTGTTPPSIALSNDGGASYTRVQDQLSIDTTFADDGVTLRLQVSLERTGTGGSSTPTEGFDGQSIDSYELRADIDETPGVIDYSEDKRLVDILNDIARDDFLWEVTTDADGNTTVEWTQPEQRLSGETPDVSDVSIQKRQEIVKRVTVQAANKRVTGERFTASESYVALNRSPTIPQSESVYDDATGEEFDRGPSDDYEIDWRDGEIRITGSSQMDSGTEYRIDYAAETTGTRQTDDYVQGDLEEVIEIPGLNTARAAEQVAQSLLNDFSEPRWQARLVIPPGSGLFSGIEAIGIAIAEELPDDASPLSPRRVERTPAGLVVELGEVESFRTRSQALKSQVASVSKRV